MWMQCISLDINDCLSSPCQHETCQDLSSAYKCACDQGYTGAGMYNANECQFKMQKETECTNGHRQWLYVYSASLAIFQSYQEGQFYFHMAEWNSQYLRNRRFVNSI